MQKQSREQRKVEKQQKNKAEMEAMEAKMNGIKARLQDVEKREPGFVQERKLLLRIVQIWVFICIFDRLSILLIWGVRPSLVIGVLIYAVVILAFGGVIYTRGLRLAGLFPFLLGGLNIARLISSLPDGHITMNLFLIIGVCLALMQIFIGAILLLSKRIKHCCQVLQEINNGLSL